MDRKAHWEAVYTTKRPDEYSWFQPSPERSLELVADAAAGPESAVIDIGGGDSRLVDGLLERGARQVTVLDISAAALSRARARLRTNAAGVTWLEADVTRAELPPRAYDVWHDRAVFHFLTDPDDRALYVSLATHALRPRGRVIVATFAPDGPPRCSGLDVARYGPEDLAREFGSAFVLCRGLSDVHRTPWGAEQRFTYAVL